MPSYSEIMAILGFKSKNAVYRLINKLVEEGVVSKDSQGRIIPNMVGGEIRMLGLVEAGIPTTADEELADTINIEDYVVPNKEASYMLTVKGDSMIDAGIYEGDKVIAERKGEPKPGDIVIALVDGGWTMKYYRKKGNQAYLEPANKKYKPIYPEHQLEIAAIVKAIIRKL